MIMKKKTLSDSKSKKISNTPIKICRLRIMESWFNKDLIDNCIWLKENNTCMKLIKRVRREFSEHLPITLMLKLQLLNQELT